MVSPLVVRRAASRSFAGATRGPVLALIAAALVACGSNTTVPQQAYVSASLGPTAASPGDASACMQAVGTPFVEIGSVNGSQYTLIPTNETFEGSTVQVSCSVTPSGNGFAVNATAVRSGNATGGTVHIEGMFTATGEQESITATFGNGTNGVYEQTGGCIADYTNSSMGVAAGRVWGVLGCPMMQLEGQSNICASTTEFRFENCSQ